MTLVSLWGPVSAAFGSGDGDDDWARFFRSRPAAARMVKISARRDAA